VPALELDLVDKRFGGIHAVRGARIAFEPGRIHAVVGENGAGKSTLLRIAAGLLAPDSGEVRIAGERLEPHSPAEAIRRGVGMVQQHFSLVEAFTALENIVLGSEPVRSPMAWLGRIDGQAAHAKAAAIAKELGVHLALDARVAELGVGDRQRLEIARALYREAKVLILDEPTAVLTPGEADALYAVLRRLATQGRAIVVVTHKLDEVRDHADVATVMRRGTLIETRPVRRTEDDVRELSNAIMGDSGDSPSVHAGRGQGAGSGRAVVVVRALQVGRRLRGVSFDVRAGEIVGVAGVEGNGQRELVRALAGLDAPDGGTLEPGPEGLAIVHEDRQEEGLVLGASVRDNVVLGELRRFVGALGVIDRRALDVEALARVDMARAPRDLDAPARTLSGGNQQKLVVARAIARIDPSGPDARTEERAGRRRRARGLVVAHPTRGVDLAASRAIHAEIRAAADKGAAVLVVSADLHELRALADRILVIARGRIRAELPPGASDAEIGHAMLAGGAGEAERAPEASA
jgi:simple sugar transport system ATP-binding protein